MPLDLTPLGNTAMPVVGLNYSWKGGSSYYGYNDLRIIGRNPRVGRGS
jgi:hypothetical protein